MCRRFQNGLKSIPAHEPAVKKYYFLTQKPKGKSSDLVRIAFFLPNNDKLVLIQYLGDEEKAVSFPHGNGKTSKPYIRTYPSTISDIKSEDPAQLPSASYKKAISKPDYPPSLQPVYKPRNSRQIHNHRALERQKFRISHDALYNVHEIAYDLKGYVAKIITYPDLVLICGLTVIEEELKRLLTTKAASFPLFSYDTTFQLGDFYVSAFLFRHTLFTEAPVIPAFFLIHERKEFSAHEGLMKHIAAKIPATNVPATNARSGFMTLATTFPLMHGLMRATSGHAATATSSTLFVLFLLYITNHIILTLHYMYYNNYYN